MAITLADLLLGLVPGYLLVMLTHLAAGWSNFGRSWREEVHNLRSFAAFLFAFIIVVVLFPIGMAIHYRTDPSVAVFD